MFGFVALLLDDAEDEPGEEAECVGALTAQTDPAATAVAATAVLLTEVVRADARRQGVGRALLAALVAHVCQESKQQQQEQQPARIVADVALANEAAWQFFGRAGFQKTQPTSRRRATAEAVLILDEAVCQQACGGSSSSSGGTSSAAAAAGRRPRRAATPHLLPRRPAVGHAARPVQAWSLHCSCRSGLRQLTLV